MEKQLLRVSLQCVWGDIPHGEVGCYNGGPMRYAERTHLFIFPLLLLDSILFILLRMIFSSFIHILIENRPPISLSFVVTLTEINL